MAQRSGSRPFRLQFRPAEIAGLAERYGPHYDEEALAAGQRIRSGHYGQVDIETIFKWKTGGRGISRLRRNSSDEIADALQLALSAKTDRAAVAVLLGLQGVAIPVASAILTAMTPERYTVIDFGALESLGSKSAERTVNFYLAYLHACRELAEAHKVKLRDLDRALWQWSSERATR